MINYKINVCKTVLKSTNSNNKYTELANNIESSTIITYMCKKPSWYIPNKREAKLDSMKRKATLKTI